MSDESKWTPEPWRLVAVDGLHRICTDRGWMGDEAVTVARIECTDNERANARRIVACVNACAGIADPSGVPALVALARTVDDGLPPRPRHLGALFLCDSCGQYASHREVARNRGSADCPDRRECGGTLFQVRDTPEERIKVAARALLARVDGGAS